jgi:hypothetical protein
MSAKCLCRHSDGLWAAHGEAVWNRDWRSITAISHDNVGDNDGLEVALIDAGPRQRNLPLV